MMYQTEAMSESTVIDALAIDGAQPAWMTLNAAREIAFTGEIVFESDPDVHAYLDNGVVYYAERVTASDAALRDRKLAFHIGERPVVITRTVIESTERH